MNIISVPSSPVGLNVSQPRLVKEKVPVVVDVLVIGAHVLILQQQYINVYSHINVFSMQV